MTGGQEDDSICFNIERERNQKTVSDKDITFCVDSGCTDHLVNQKECFSNLVMLKESIKIAVAKDKNYLEAVGIGDIEALSQIDDKDIKCKIKGVLYVPNLRRNLLSVKKLEISEIKTIFENGQVKLVKNERLIGIGYRSNLYVITFKLIKNECLNVECENETARLWHRRYGHIGYSNLNKLISNRMVEGIHNVHLKGKEICEDCLNGKMTRTSFGIRRESNRILEIVHSDVCGPITPTSHDGHRYFVTFIDGHSGFVCVYMIKGKYEVYEKFKEYVQMSQAKFNQKISILRCDNGGEYVSEEFRKYCKENGTSIDYNIPYTPQQNGKAERFNRSLVEKARSMLSDSNLTKEFWSEAIRTATYIINRSPSTKLPGVTPAEIWYGEKPNVQNFKIFGSVAYTHIPKELRNKFDVKSKKCIFVGYAKTGYRLWDSEKEKIIISRDTVVDEKIMYQRKTSVQIFDESKKETDRIRLDLESSSSIDSETNSEYESTEEVDENLSRN